MERHHMNACLINLPRLLTFEFLVVFAIDILSLGLNISFIQGVENMFFLGYPYGKKGWHVYELEIKEMYVSLDIIFHENIFLFGNEISFFLC